MFLKAVSIIFLFLVRPRFPRHLSTIKIFRKRYRHVIVRKAREFEKLHIKYRKVLLDIDFLNTCFKNNIIPKFVQFRVSNKDLRNSTAYTQCQIELLNQENHVCNVFLIGNDKSILKHQQIQNKNLTHLRVIT